MGDHRAQARWEVESPPLRELQGHTVSPVPMLRDPVELRVQDFGVHLEAARPQPAAELPVDLPVNGQQLAGVLDQERLRQSN